MSVALMALAFKAAVNSTQKLVLLALCDAANDLGECYPSVPTLAEKCSLGQRTVQAALSDLERMGYLARELRVGRATTYWCKPSGSGANPAASASHPRSSRTPAAAAPPQQPHHTPADAAPPPPQQPHHTPADAAPITTKEPSVEPSVNQNIGVQVSLIEVEAPKRRKPETVAVSVLVMAGFNVEAAEDFIAHKAAKKAPLTERAWKDHLRESASAGWSPLQAAEKTMARGWSGFEARYVVGDPPRQQLPMRSTDAALKPRQSRHAGFASKDYTEGVTEDGHLA